MGWVKGIINNFKPLPYEQQRQIAKSGTKTERLTLAKSSKTNKEILFYLAENDPETIVRQQVALNKTTPLHANKILAGDAHEDVRLALSGRLVKLLPELSIDKQSQLYAYTVQALGTLALDEVLKIRKSLAVTLKDHAYAPPLVAAQLAKDIEREVAEPILRFCVALDDDVIVDILKSHSQPWAAETIAQRSKISARISKAVIATNNMIAGKHLIENKGAEIDEDVLHEIIIRAKEFPEWHEPIVKNHKLPENMAHQLAKYADSRIRKLLQDKGGFNFGESEVVTDVTRRRIKLEEKIKNRTPRQLKKYIRELEANDNLNEIIVLDHLALRDNEFVVTVLAHKLNISLVRLNKALTMKKAETICALCWKSGFSMRFAFRLQQDLAGISHQELIVPRNGTDYPLSEKDMLWYLEYLDIK